MTSETTTQEQPCAHCGELTDQEPQEYDGIDQVICDDCYGEFEYCQFCKIHPHRDSTCRHLCWIDDWGDFGGCGSDRSDWDKHKASFHFVLDKIGVDAAKALLHALKAHRYHHRFSGTIFGYNSLDAHWQTENGIKNFGHLFTQSLFDEQEKRMAIGVQWLVSLWAGDVWNGNDCDLAKSPEADDRTVQWIEEWLSAQDRTVITPA